MDFVAPELEVEPSLRDMPRFVLMCAAVGAGVSFAMYFVSKAVAENTIHNANIGLKEYYASQQAP